jgi:uncharacterized protein YgbK (DUF1537 family)
VTRSAPVSVVIGADDRTGALEVAGACASPGMPVTVTVWPDASGVGGVVDAGTRALDPPTAARRAGSVGPAAWKLDSRLRGNWADELVALARWRGRPVWVVAALPSMGRTCRNGVVRDETTGDVLGRPASVLGETAVVWDAATDDDLAAIGARWRAVPAAERPVLAGTSAAVAAAVAPGARPAPAPIEAPVVVVCGSLHPAARAELAQLPPSVRVLTTPASAVLDPLEAARGLRDRLDGLDGPSGPGRVGTLVVVGGDTAAVVLGDGPLAVGGLMAPGVPWARRPDGTGPLVITRSGGFHGPAALTAVLGAHCAP